MAIARDSSAKSSGGTGVTATYNHTVGAGPNRVIIGAAAGATFFTIGGVAATLLAQEAYVGNPTGPLQAWGLIAPAVGSVAIVSDASAQYCTVSYTGVKQTGLPDAIVTQESAGGATSLTTNITTIDDNCWLVCVEGAYIFNVAPGAGTGLTLLQSTISYAVPSLFDSNGAKTPAGSHSGQTTLPFGNESIKHILLSLAPAGAAVAGLPHQMTRSL